MNVGPLAVACLIRRGSTAVASKSGGQRICPEHEKGEGRHARCHISQSTGSRREDAPDIEQPLFTTVDEASQTVDAFIVLPVNLTILLLAPSTPQRLSKDSCCSLFTRSRELLSTPKPAYPSQFTSVPKASLPKASLERPHSASSQGGVCGVGSAPTWRDTNNYSVQVRSLVPTTFGLADLLLLRCWCERWDEEGTEDCEQTNQNNGGNETCESACLHRAVPRKEKWKRKKEGKKPKKPHRRSRSYEQGLFPRTRISLKWIKKAPNVPENGTAIPHAQVHKKSGKLQPIVRGLGAAKAGRENAGACSMALALSSPWSFQRSFQACSAECGAVSDMRIPGPASPRRLSVLPFPFLSFSTN